MNAKLSAAAILMAPLFAIGCSCAQKAGCSSCRNSATPTASIVKDTPVAKTETAPAVAIVPANRPTPPAEPAPLPIVVRPEPAYAGEMQSAPVAAPVLNTPTTGVRAHSPDYTSLVGQLHYSARTNEWRLRYAEYDVEDTYGGCVTLTGVGRLMSGFKDGQLARVQGEIVNRDTRQPSPAYAVREIFPLQ